MFVATFALLSRIQMFTLEAFAGVSTHTSKSTVSMLVVGDAMFDRNVRKLMETHGFDYPFHKIKEIVSKFDIALLNLEGVYTDYESISLKDRSVLRFTFDRKGIQALKNAGFDVVSQANNHTADFGREGATLSRRYLEYSGIKVVGDYFNEAPFLTFHHKKKQIAVVAYNEFSSLNTSTVLNEISRLKQEKYFVVVFPHFGLEYERFPADAQKLLARSFIDYGADIVIGAHPHVIQVMEEYKEKPIFYSIGNFIFDQYFSKETQESLAVSLNIEDMSFDVGLLVLGQERSVPYRLSQDQEDVVIEELVKDSSINEEWKDSILKNQRFTVFRK